MNSPPEPSATTSPTQPPQRLSCPGCTRTRLQEMAACDQTPCRLRHRRLDLRGKAGAAPPLAIGLMLFGLGFALIGALVILPILFGIPHPLLLIGGLLFVTVFCAVSLFFAGIGALMYMGRQTELMATGADQAMLSLDINGFVVGGYHYTEIQKVDPQAADWPLQQPASTALIDPQSDNAEDVLQSALLNLLALGRAELWQAQSTTYLLGRRFGTAEPSPTLYFRPFNQIVPSGSLERELWDLLRRWEREPSAGRGPVGLSIADLLEDYFQRKTLNQPGQALCRRVRAAAEASSGPVTGSETARADYQSWYTDWQSRQPELALQLRREVAAALLKRERNN